jgi:hypothetical protein
MKRLLLLCFCLVASRGTAFAQQQVDIVGMRDNFIVAGIAARKCNANDPNREDLLDRNFTIISRKAMEAIVARSPGADQEEVRKKDLAHIEELQDAAFNLIRTEGCKSEKVRALLRLHKIHESMRF